MTGVLRGQGGQETHSALAGTRRAAENPSNPDVAEPFQQRQKVKERAD